MTSILDDAGINYLSVTGRTKTVASFAEKARRTRDGVPLYTDPLREITDTIGIRVITYVHSDVSAVADLLRDQVVVNDDRDMGRETAQEGRFGYASRHLLIGLDAAREGHPSYELMRGHTAQIQIRTVLQHAWAEFEHDIRYKGTMPDEHARDFDRRFTLAAGLLELADREFSTIRDTLRASAASADATTERRHPTTTRGSTRASSRRSWPGSTPSRAGRAPTTTPGSPACCSSSASPHSTSSARCCARATRRLIRTRMDYRYPPGAVRRLDDALLAAYGSAYVDLPRQRPPPGRARGPPRAVVRERLAAAVGRQSSSVGHVDVDVVAVLEDRGDPCRPARGVGPVARASPERRAASVQMRPSKMTVLTSSRSAWATRYCAIAHPLAWFRLVTGRTNTSTARPS